MHTFYVGPTIVGEFGGSEFADMNSAPEAHDTRLG